MQEIIAVNSSQENSAKIVNHLDQHASNECTGESTHVQT